MSTGPLRPYRVPTTLGGYAELLLSDADAATTVGAVAMPEAPAPAPFLAAPTVLPGAELTLDDDVPPGVEATPELVPNKLRRRAVANKARRAQADKV